MLERASIPVFYLTLLLGSFLLFAVQPLFAKMILPLLGGASAVWITAMLFFQIMLLAGYAYAHLMARYVPLKWQFILHPALLALCALSLPIAVPAGWEPPFSENPAFWQLGLMGFAIGGPFFALSGGAPLLQHWFAQSGHCEAQNPYFLYAASNIGSMAALLAYPVLIEPLLPLKSQSLYWSGAYLALIALIIITALLTRKSGVAAIAAQTRTESTDAPTTKDRLGWLFLSFVPASLLLGVTNFATTDLASAPLLWLIPMTLYLLAFIIAFSRIRQSLYKDAALFTQIVLLLAVTATFMPGNRSFMVVMLGAHFALFFLSALICIVALVNSKPAASHLTSFYLFLAIGGALGGVFNALLAPLIFKIPLEYPLMLGAALLARDWHAPEQSFRNFWGDLRAGLSFKKPLPTPLRLGLVAAILSLIVFVSQIATFKILALIGICIIIFKLRHSRWILALAAIFTLLINPGYYLSHASEIKLMKRNYYGLLRVHDDKYGYSRVLSYGTTNHVAQALLKNLRHTPISYYYPETAFGDVFRVLDTRPGPQKIAVIGLGTGTLACYSRPGRHFDFYEINPAVITIAENPELFTYLSGCGSPYDILRGDGRLQIARAKDSRYDVIFLDAFSSDSIPMHLLTREATAIYLQKLKPGGFIVFHISNRHVDLAPVVEANARALGAQVLFKHTESKRIGATDIYMIASDLGIMAKDESALNAFRNSMWMPYSGRQLDKPWTDDFSNLTAVMKVFYR